VEATKWLDRSIVLDVEKLGWLDRSLNVNVEKLIWLDRGVLVNVIYPAWLDRSIILNVEKLGWWDRNLLLNVEKAGWLDRVIQAYVVRHEYSDRPLSMNVEKIQWLDRSVSVDVFNYEKGWLDRSLLLNVQRFGEPMLGAYHFPHPQRLRVTWRRSIARRDIAGRGKDYRADLGGLGAKAVLTGFIYSDSWESERQPLEAKKDEAAAHFDDGTGVKFNATVYDVEFSREITDPISGRKGVIYVVRMAEAS
jgi:hypothetical protein